MKTIWFNRKHNKCVVCKEVFIANLWLKTKQGTISLWLIHSKEQQIYGLQRSTTNITKA